jgi:hypothetical protein
MPIKEKPAKHVPSRKELEILARLGRAEEDQGRTSPWNKQRGLPYHTIRTETGLSDTALSQLLKRLTYFKLIEKPLGRLSPYRLTNHGIQIWHQQEPLIIVDRTPRERHRDRYNRLWRELHNAQAKVLQFHFSSLPRNHFLRVVLSMQPKLMWAGAFKGQQGNKAFLMKSLSPDDLRKLGYESS